MPPDVAARIVSEVRRMRGPQAVPPEPVPEPEPEPESEPEPEPGHEPEPDGRLVVSRSGDGTLFGTMRVWGAAIPCPPKACPTTAFRCMCVVRFPREFEPISPFTA